MGKMYLNGTPYSTEITESRFNYDLLLENTNFTITTGTGNVDRTYTLNNSIDDYDAVMIFGYMMVTSAGRQQVASMTIMNKDFYTTPVGSTSNYAFLLNGSITNTHRRICFKFTDSTHIATSTGSKLDTEEPRLWKVYGLKFPNETGIKNNDIPIYLGSQLLYKDRVTTTSTSKTDFFCDNYYNGDADHIHAIVSNVVVPSGYEVQYRVSALLNSQEANQAQIYINEKLMISGGSWIGSQPDTYLGHFGDVRMSNLFKFSDIPTEPRYLVPSSDRQGYNFSLASSVDGKRAWAENVTIHAYLVKKYWH